MKKIFIVSCLCLLVSGCGAWVDQKSIDNAMALCKPNGGLRHLSIFAAEIATCNNGAEFHRAEWKILN